MYSLRYVKLIKYISDIKFIKYYESDKGQSPGSASKR